jgi:hypothetical protein
VKIGTVAGVLSQIKQKKISICFISILSLLLLPYFSVYLILDHFSPFLLYLSTAPVTYSTIFLFFQAERNCHLRELQIRGQAAGSQAVQGAHHLQHPLQGRTGQGGGRALRTLQVDLGVGAYCRYTREYGTVHPQGEKNPTYTVYRRVEPYTERKAETPYRQCFSSGSALDLPP